ncbi:phosphate ABC transporter permease PstA [Salisediminibacterium halotolerans]|uniref:Phosphate transport system permease protein PstA n=1 Tax=Salisediminibacterium halotolerans TaxID=517425 RepID=A0A1H9U3Z2_9BACI|nr:phosphate ABC transporter permease PstA [Salisediminibacterium haloalkalitolerans]SES04280.1 phosphate transport system permease protein [Salisediminibacterium haloalkalitolerans]
MLDMQSLSIQNRMKQRLYLNAVIKKLFAASTLVGLIVLAVLLYRVVRDSIGWLNWSFLTSTLSGDPSIAGIIGAIAGTFWLMAIVGPFTMIIGVSTAIYLELYAGKSFFSRLLQTNIANLAGVPSIVFGLLGLTLFVRLMGMGSSVLAGGLTLSLLVLPIVIVSSQEAIRSVPGDIIEASYGMGAGKWQTIQRIVLPAALPGILTGMILSLSRAIGETAPLIALGIPALLIPVPSSPMDSFTALPVQIYYWTIDAVLTADYFYLASATIVVLLLILLLLNSAAVIIRNKFDRRY